MMTTNRQSESGENPGRERPGKGRRTGSVRDLRAGLWPEVLLLLIFTGLLSLAGCDETFEPWIENDRYHYSIYGYLDASADTQWVRVMPVREDFLLDPGQPLDATVTLEHVETGEMVVMNDSLFGYAHGAYAWNFWTTYDLYPEQTYRIRAERSDGVFSQAQTRLPADFPTPSIRVELRWPSGLCCSPLFAIWESVNIYVDEIERLADVQTVYRAIYPETGEKYIIGLPHLQDTVRVGSGYQVIIDPMEDYGYMTTFFPMNPSVQPQAFFGPNSRYFPQQVFIVSAGPDYLYFPSIDEKIVALPEGVSNVVNGVGYLAGMVSKTIPLLPCLDETERPVSCDPEPTPW